MNEQRNNASIKEEIKKKRLMKRLKEYHFLPDSEEQGLFGGLVQFKGVIRWEPYAVTLPHQTKQAAVHWRDPWVERENNDCFFFNQSNQRSLPGKVTLSAVCSFIPPEKLCNIVYIKDVLFQFHKRPTIKNK